MLTFLLPDRLPGLIVLVGFWIPPAMADLRWLKHIFFPDAVTVF